MQTIEKWRLLARLQFAPRCIFSDSPCIFVNAGNFCPRLVRARLAHQPVITYLILHILLSF